MALESQKTADARFDTARLTTLIASGVVLMGSGAVAVIGGDDELDIIVGLGACIACVMAATGVGRRASLIGTRSLARVSLIVVGVSSLLLTPMVIVLSAMMMTVAFATGAMGPTGLLVLQWSGVAAAGGLVLLCALFAAVDLGRSGRIPSPWGWLALPALTLGVVGSSIKAGIGAAAAMAWMSPYTGLYRVITAFQSIGAVGFGALMVALGGVLGVVSLGTRTSPFR
ncbi:hypothetical protein AB0N64_08970 [Microbacterium sp. NPDC089318]